MYSGIIKSAASCSNKSPLSCNRLASHVCIYCVWITLSFRSYVSNNPLAILKWYQLINHILVLSKSTSLLSPCRIVFQALHMSPILLLPPFIFFFFSSQSQLSHCVIKYLCAELNFSIPSTVKSLWRRSPDPHSPLFSLLRCPLSQFSHCLPPRSFYVPTFVIADKGPKTFFHWACHYTLRILEQLLDKCGCFEGLHACVYNLCFVNNSSSADGVKKVSAWSLKLIYCEYLKEAQYVQLMK